MELSALSRKVFSIKSVSVFKLPSSLMVMYM